MTQRIHPFERRGLGNAPFRFVGYSQAKYQAAPGAPVQPGRVCDYCGTGIMDVYHVESADGQHFVVGCDCIRKVAEEFDGSIPPDARALVAQVEADKRAAKRQAKWERVRVRCAAAREALAAAPALFSDRPHPNAYFAGQGRTLRDYVEWSLQNAGDAGRTEACRMIETATATR